MNNQEQNREALIRHIADLDAVIRRRNEQIENQAHNARETQRALEEVARERDEARADAESLSRQLYDAQQDADMSRAELEGEPRPLTPDAITDEMVERAIRKGIEFGWFLEGDVNVRDVRKKTRAILESALGIPARPEGAEKVEAVLHQYWSGDIDGDDLADRIAEEMNR